MRARSARRLSVLPARTQLSSMDRSSGVKVRAVGYLLIPHHGIYRLSLQLSTSSSAVSNIWALPANPGASLLARQRVVLCLAQWHDGEPPDAHQRRIREEL